MSNMGLLSRARARFGPWGLRGSDHSRDLDQSSCFGFAGLQLGLANKLWSHITAARPAQHLQLSQHRVHKSQHW